MRGGKGAHVGQKADKTSRSNFQAWYDKNRDALSEKRKKRYAEDSDYREKVKSAARKRWQDQRKARGGGESRTRGGNRPRNFRVGNQDVVVYGVSEYAYRIGRDVQTISAWEEREIVPTPTVVDEHGRRWYSERHMDLVAAVVAKFDDKGGRKLLELKKKIWDAWARAATASRN